VNNYQVAFFCFEDALFAIRPPKSADEQGLHESDKKRSWQGLGLSLEQKTVS
jgi:hypothetical protein